MSLAQKAAYGVAWATLTSIIVRSVSFITQIVLARLLAPSDFGLIAIGMLVINTMGLFRDLGFGTALIYKKDDNNYAAANTSFIILPFIASMLVLLAHFLAPYLAIFFENSIIEPMVQVLSLTFLLSSIGTIPSILLEKELEFKKKIIPETVPVVGYSFVTILLAINGYGVWSLVYGQVASAILTATSIWIVSDWKPNLSFNFDIAMELFNYGKHIITASVILFLIANVDDALVGKYLGTEALGFYTMAFLISNLPATQITHLIGRVMFPTYSKLQDNKVALKNAYTTTLEATAMVSIPVALGILITAPDFVNLFLGQKWLPAVPLIQILCFYGLFRSLNATTGPLFQASGNPQILRNISFLHLILFCIVILPLMNLYGLIGVCIAGVLPQMAINLLAFYNVGLILDSSMLELATYLKKVAYATGLSVLTVVMLLKINFTNTPLISFIVSIIVFSTIFFVSIFLMDKNILQKYKSFFRG